MLGEHLGDLKVISLKEFPLLMFFVLLVAASLNIFKNYHRLLGPKK